jgi:hypothetical protein
VDIVRGLVHSSEDLKTCVRTARRRRALASSLGALLAASLSACGWLPSEEAPPGCAFPDGAALSFAGETSLAALGLADGSNFDNRIGRIYVSRDKLPYTGSIPIGVDGPVAVPDVRQYCALYADDISALGGVPDGWSPPRP